MRIIFLLFIAFFTTNISIAQDKKMSTQERLKELARLKKESDERKKIEWDAYLVRVQESKIAKQQKKQADSIEKSKITPTVVKEDELSELTHTIDRTKVRRISSPEIIRRTVIDFGGVESTWSLPLTKEVRISEVEADPESVRINSADEVTLMEAFLHWQQKIAK